MRFQIGDNPKIYDAQSVDQLSLKSILLLERQTAELGRVLHMADLERISAELEALSDDNARAAHPDAPWMIAVTVWAARNLNGDALTFGDAIDFPMSALKFLPEPADHKAPAHPRKARPRSARAAEPALSDPAPGPSETSEPALRVAR